MTKIIDADGHIVEPHSLWREYIEPKFRDRIPQVAKDAEGIDRMQVEGRLLPRSPLMIAAMCVPGGLSNPERARQISWDDLRPGSFDPHERIKDMDDEGIDVSILYGSIGLAYGGLRDPELAAACCRAYNNWMTDFCKPYPDRLYNVAPVPLIDVPAAIAEMGRVVKDHGVKSVAIRPNPYNDRRLSDAVYDPFWTEAEELNCTIAVHSTVGGDLPTVGFDRYPDFFQRMVIAHPLEQQMACMDLTCGGVLEKHPRLRVAFLETGGGWLSYWLSRLDEFYEKIGHMLPPLTLKPSEYFYRQCFLSCEPDDMALKTAIALGTENVLMWASDYPHFDCTYPGVVEELRESCETLPDSAQRKIMGENAARCYGIA
ncbi:MAG: amidohydrolase [Deltaproteobacteria bacterium]|nr:amidohydrolase [Deltaproteobacteria bacterium]